MHICVNGVLEMATAQIIKNNHDPFAICYAMCAFESQVMEPQSRKGASRARPRQYPHGNPHNHL